MKCKLIGVCNTMKEKLEVLKDLPLLFMRLVLAYGFYKPAMMKWKDIDGIASWFDGMGLPFPTFNAYMATITETLGFVLLFFGFATRLISIPLIIVMLVAIVTVHGFDSFDAGDNGFEIPLYYMIMLFTLFVYGPGKISLQHLFTKKD
jgi:putative oxidoreductase